MTDRSTKVVYAALAGNVLVAVSKYAAAAVSGSTAMLTEAIHSTADCTNQGLLLLGNRRSRAAPDAGHPFGHGGEIYFWAFVVAVMVLLAGGVASVVEGVLQLRHPEPVRAPAVSLTVLGLSVLFEGGSLLFGYRESRRVVRSHPVPGERIGLWRFIKLSKDPNLYESLLEDAAALVGIGIAGAGVAGNVWLGLLWADGAASIGIGVLLVAFSVVVADATRRLIAGEAVAFPLRRDLERALAGWERPAVDDLRSLHLGPRTILLTLDVHADEAGSGAELRDDLDRLTARLKAVDPRVVHVFFRLQ